MSNVRKPESSQVQTSKADKLYLYVMSSSVGYWDLQVYNVALNPIQNKQSKFMRHINRKDK